MLKRLALLLSLCLLWSYPLSARQFRGVEFADKVRVGQWGTLLGLKGVSAIDRHYLPLHLVALYTDPRQNDAADLANALAPCRIAIRWQVSPELSSADAAAYWHERLDQLKLEAEQLRQLTPALNKMISAFGAAKRGDELLLDYDPEQGLRVTRNGQIAGQFAGVAFSRAVLGLWLAADAPARNELLGITQPREDKL